MRSSAALYTPATGSAGKSRLRDTWRLMGIGGIGSPPARPARPERQLLCRPELGCGGESARLRAGRPGVKSRRATYWLGDPQVITSQGPNTSEGDSHRTYVAG